MDFLIDIEKFIKSSKPNNNKDRFDKHEDKSKINQLEDLIEELEKKLYISNELIEEEKNKNKELKNLLENNNSLLTELKDEIKLFKLYYNIPPEEKIISIKFISVDQVINFTLNAKVSDVFTKIETILYEKYPAYKDTENYFLNNGRRVNRHRTLDENNIKNNDTITLNIIDI